MTPPSALVTVTIVGREVPGWLRDTWSDRLARSPTQTIDVAEALGDVMRYADAPSDIAAPLAELVWIASQSGGDPFVTLFLRDSTTLGERVHRFGPTPTRRGELAMERDRLESIWRFLALLPPVGHVARAFEMRASQKEHDEKTLSRFAQRRGTKPLRALSLPRCTISQQREGKQWWNQ